MTRDLSLPTDSTMAAAVVPSTAMRERNAALFESLRSEVVEHILEARNTVETGWSTSTPELLRQQLDGILDRMQQYLLDEDADRYRDFVSRWVAFHLGEGRSPEDMVHSVVSLIDVMVQVARRTLPVGPTTADLVRQLNRMSLVGTRLVVDILGEELDGLRTQGGTRVGS
jgi:hypothetical protein